MPDNFALQPQTQRLKVNRGFMFPIHNILARLGLWLHLVAFALAALYPTGAVAQQAQEYEVARDRSRVADSSGPLGTSLFGEQVSLYDGTTVFATTDVSVPGNFGLPVEFGRRHTVTATNNTSRFPLADWDFDLPAIHATFPSPTGWTMNGSDPGARCSANRSMPVDAKGAYQVTFKGGEVWGGNSLRLPGGQEIAVRAAAAPETERPAGSAAYKWTTSTRWYFSCLPTVKTPGRSGEGFLGIDPNGTRYYFDWATTVPIQSQRKGTPGLNNTMIGRNEEYLYPTKIVDRFGNSVTYAWVGSLLTSIESSDGRRIAIAYKSLSGRDYVDTVTVGQRVWTYSYGSVSSDKWGLTSVTLPDQSRWNYNFQLVGEFVSGPWFGTDRCSANPGRGSGSTVYVSTSPSGARAEFTFWARRHTRAYVSPSCAWSEAFQVDNSGSPGTFYWVPSLTSKVVTGPGLPRQEWTIAFPDARQYGSWMSCLTDCGETKKTLVKLTDGRQTLYTFSTDFRRSEGLLLKEETKDQAGSALQQAEYTYELAPSTQFRSEVGLRSGFYGESPVATMVIPVKSVKRTLDSQEFLYRVETFDWAARATSVVRASGPGGSLTNPPPPPPPPPLDPDPDPPCAKCVLL